MKRIIIDTDAGIDDALAIILALKSPELKVQAITTVAGNVEVEKCTRNCLLLLDLLQPEHTPIVAQGAKKPLVRKLFTAPEVHGDDGLGNVVSQYPTPQHRATRRNAVDVIIDVVKEHPKRVTVVAIGPLTNIALAIAKDLRTMRNVREIIAMGGAFRVAGNTGPVAEFNTYVDPEATNYVFGSAVPVTLIPLDVTQQAVIKRSDIVRLARKAGNRVGLFIERITKKYMQYHKETEGFLGGYLHDPLAVAVAIRKRLIRCRELHVDVETQGDITRGMTVAELRPACEKRPSNAHVAYQLKRREFLDLFQSRVWS